jgi:hypothetical protein
LYVHLFLPSSTGQGWRYEYNVDTNITNTCYAGLFGLGRALNAQGNYCLGVASKIIVEAKHL